MSCAECKEHKLKAHHFDTPSDYELHAENALSSLYGEEKFMSQVMDELLYTLDNLERPEKNNLMAMLLKENPRYKEYLNESGECGNIKGCHGKSCECLSFKSFSELNGREQAKVKSYANLFYNR